MDLEEVKKYVILVQDNNDNNAFNILVKNYKKLLAHFVHRYSHLPLSKEELESAAIWGFYKGILRYDYVKNTMQPFTTYVCNAIINEIYIENRKLKRERNRELLFLDETLQDDGIDRVVNHLEGMNEEDIFRMATKQYNSEVIDEMLKCLKPKQREIIKYRFGVCGYPEKKLAELAKIYGCTIQYISAYEHDALKKIRKLYSNKYQDLI